MMRGQLSMEFVLVFVFSMLVFIILFGFVVSGFSDQEEARLINRAESLSRHLALTIDLIATGPAEASYEFTFPPQIGGLGYEVEIRERMVFVTIDEMGIRTPHPIRTISLAGAFEADPEDHAKIHIEPGAECSVIISRTTDETEVIVDDCT